MITLNDRDCILVTLIPLLPMIFSSCFSRFPALIVGVIGLGVVILTLVAFIVWHGSPRVCPLNFIRLVPPFHWFPFRFHFTLNILPFLVLIFLVIKTRCRFRWWRRALLINPSLIWSGFRPRRRCAPTGLKIWRGQPGFIKRLLSPT